MSEETTDRNLIAAIQSYWADRGHAVKVWSEIIHLDDRRPGMREIRSNMVNGFPPSARPSFLERRNALII